MGHIRRTLPGVIGVLLASFVATSCGQGALVGASYGAPMGAPTIDELAEATYGGVLDRPVTLHDGRWEGRPSVEDGSSRPTVGLIKHFRLTGDLDGDGRDEAVALLWESSGGSGTRLYLAVGDRNDGEVENLASALIGDRVQVRAGSVSGNRIVLDLVEAGPDDAACCPTQRATTTWALGPEGLSVASSEATGTLSITDLQGPEWVLAELGRDRPVTEDVEITLGFEDDRAAGTGGCNRYFGTVNSEAPGRFHFSGMGATRMACPEPAMGLEQQYLGTLAGATSYSFLAGRLVVSCDTDDGPVALVFAPRE